jgi:hypothetical protein
MFGGSIGSGEKIGNLDKKNFVSAAFGANGGNR